ncbi:alkaline phosphatase family protein [Streptacidiphilus rugosus]|uniref:hypothetical protein n=1 Tax=Streptacidiphilus rugosus TaxID=405783 RepID=UPI00068BAC6E|nr:hypothetical protein [Streptacidiphilus rugosus]
MRKSKVLALAVTAGLGIGAAVAAPAMAAQSAPTRAKTESSCRLDDTNPGLKHVIYLQFDNVHFTRDNPNVPSDLEQMPHLLSFLTSNGVVDTNHHTPLIAHTGNDILTSLTGVYGDRHGQSVANSYRYFNPDGSSNSASSFAYWTDGVADTSVPTPSDPAYTMVTKDGKNAPAPWVSYTRAGCDFGAVSAANTILENTTVDIDKVFGANSAEAAEAKADQARAQADYVGIGVHCALNSKLCASAGAGASADLLPDEPGGYTGYQALFGAKAVDPAIAGSAAVNSTSGTPITDPKGNPGFPGFDGMSAANSLGYVAQMQEAGVPVTYAYISDAHDRHVAPFGAFGPGEAGYVAQLKTYDDAFAAFFSRLAKDGITTRNTDFVVTSDENDHFVGGTPSPANCDGVTVPCSYAQIGEVNANATGLLATQQGVTTPFKVHADSAPNFYLDGNPAQTAPSTRSLEQAWAKVTAVNPISGKTDTINNYLADRTEMKLLHMVTGDAARTPTFTSFADPDYYVYAGAANCNSACVALGPAFAWNHGDFSTDINTTWLGIAGVGVKHLGVTDRVWSDHTDIRPTMLALTGLRDDYRSDGVVLTPFLRNSSLRRPLERDAHQYAQVAAAYKQLNAGVGSFAAATLTLSNKGVSSASAGDLTYLADEGTLTALGAERDALAAQMAAALDDVAFGHGRLDDRKADLLVKQAGLLVRQAQRAAAAA